jgi:hypothetical protein
MQQHVFMGVESVAFKSGIQCLLVEANSGANPEMTQKKGINLCTAVAVLPLIWNPERRRVLLPFFTVAGVGDGQLQQSAHELHWHGRLSRRPHVQQRVPGQLRGGMRQPARYARD